MLDIKHLYSGRFGFLKRQEFRSSSGSAGREMIESYRTSIGEIDESLARSDERTKNYLRMAKEKILDEITDYVSAGQHFYQMRSFIKIGKWAAIIATPFALDLTLSVLAGYRKFTDLNTWPIKSFDDLRYNLDFLLTTGGYVYSGVFAFLGGVMASDDKLHFEEKFDKGNLTHENLEELEKILEESAEK